MTVTDGKARARKSSRRIWPQGIAGRVFLSTAAVVGVVLLAALAMSSYSSRRAARAAERRNLEQAADLTAQFLAARSRTIAGGARVFVQGPYFHSLVARHDPNDMIDQAIEAALQIEADWAFITDERGVLLAKSDEPGVAGVPMGRVPLIAGALEGRVTSGFGVSRDSILFQAVAVPISEPLPGTAPIGVLVVTKLLDRQLALDVRAASGADVIFYALDEEGVAHVAETSLERQSDAVAALPPAGTRTPTARSAQLGELPYSLQGASLPTAGGEIVGGFVVGRPVSSTTAEAAGMRRSLLLAGALGLLLALVAAWSSARRVTRPARTLATAAASALEGDYDAAAKLAEEAASAAGSVPNEVATLGTALTTLLHELREKRSLGAAVGAGRAAAPAEDDVTSLDSEEDTPERGGTERRRSSRPRVSGPSSRLRSGPTATVIQPATRWPARTAATLPAGTLVAERYEIAEVRGAGGSGIVYRAIDRTLGESVALKMLRPELVTDDPRAREELKRELRLTRRVSHRNVVRTYDFGTSSGIPFLTMEYVEGTALSTVIAHRGALRADAVIALARQLVRALDAAHEQGITHGDLKPANLLVTMDGLLKVTDFGVASIMRRPKALRLSATLADEEIERRPPHLAGAVVGTPEYMAPELLVGGLPDVRTDLYAAGMVLHECLTGTTPFQRDTPRAFLAQKLDPPDQPAAPTRKAARAIDREPVTVEAVIAWMTAPDPSDRPAAAAEVGAVLARLG